MKKEAVVIAEKEKLDYITGHSLGSIIAELVFAQKQEYQAHHLGLLV
jgi:hypothetical protein